MRIDLLVDTFLIKKNKKIDSKKIHEFMNRKDIYPLICDQEEFNWDNYFWSSKYIFIDSYSELTDQKFIHKSEGWSFCANFGDLLHTNKFNTIFECEGLLNLTKMEEYYRVFLNYIKVNYPKKIVILINFPANLDIRLKFKNRADQISLVYRNLAKEFSFVRLLLINDEFIVPNELDNYPYHFGKLTYDTYVENLEILVK